MCVPTEAEGEEVGEMTDEGGMADDDHQEGPEGGEEVEGEEPQQAPEQVCG